MLVVALFLCLCHQAGEGQNTVERIVVFKGYPVESAGPIPSRLPFQTFLVFPLLYPLLAIFQIPQIWPEPAQHGPG